MLNCLMGLPFANHYTDDFIPAWSINAISCKRLELLWKGNDLFSDRNQFLFSTIDSNVFFRSSKWAPEGMELIDFQQSTARPREMFFFYSNFRFRPQTNNFKVPVNSVCLVFWFCKVKVPMLIESPSAQEFFENTSPHCYSSETFLL